MKTQLLQDIEENGSKAGPPSGPDPSSAAPRPERASLIERAAGAPHGRVPTAPSTKPQVWRRPAARPDAAVRQEPDAAPLRRPREPLSFTPASPPGPAPRARAEPPPALASAPPTPSATSAGPAPGADPAAIPGWLAERLREDAEQEHRAQWRSLWQRRVFAWSMGASLLAVVAAGGLWLYEENRVDGALVVVASTSPEASAVATPAAVLGTRHPASTPDAPVAPLAPAAATVTASAAPPADAPPPVTPPAPVAASEMAPPVDAAVPPEPADVPRQQVTAPLASGAVAGAAVAATTTRKASARKPSQRRKQVQAAPARRPDPRVQAAADARQRREETLMQCRAHGYDQRQCDRRGCEMTRFGFACKG